MRGSALLAVFIPRLQDSDTVDQDALANRAQLSGTEAVVTGKHKRLEPKFTRLIFAFRMNVRWLAAVEAREEEPVRSRNTFDAGHVC
jgi:hypothetical protein